MIRLPAKAEAFFETHREEFYLEALRLVKEDYPPKDEEIFIQSILSYYDSLYLDVEARYNDLLHSLNKKDAQVELLLMALGWYLNLKVENEDWKKDFLEAWQERIRLPKEPKETINVLKTPISFGESSGFFVHNHIVSLFSKIKEDNEKVVFLNLYMGVPIKYEASIIRIENDEVTFRTSPLQEIAMINDNQAYIMENGILSRPVKAEVVYCDIPKNEVTLKNFTYMFNMPASMRDSARVHPRSATPVILVDMDRKKSVEGIMFDISTGGLGVLSKTNDGLKIGSLVHVFFDLKDEVTVSVETDAKIVDIIEYDDAHRFCMRFMPRDSNMHEAIIKYVRKREVEAIEELKNQLEEYM